MGGSFDFAGTERFHVVRQLGEGGMGVVYEAEDRRRRHRVALKTIKRRDLDTEYRLKREFRALADLAHPNLVDLYELVIEDGRCFFTMELVDGRSIIDYCRPGDGPGARGSSHDTRPDALAGAMLQTIGMGDAERIRAAMAGLARGLTTLHAAGKVHRDIKPSNVLVTRDGRVVLLDFGLVADLSDVVEDSLAGRLVGTVEYVAPEQVSGGPLTAAADWYSVGVLLYEALTGTVPHTGALMQILMGKEKGVATWPRELVPDVSEELDALCRGLLATEPSRRLQGSEVLALLGVDAGKHSRPSCSNVIELSPFTGRGRELARLQRALARTQGGESLLVWVHGSSGMGKSALIRRFLDDARRRDPEAVILDGRCYETETVPYNAMDSLIDQLSRFWGQLPRPAADALVPAGGWVLARVFPMLGRVPSVADAPRAASVPEPHELRSAAAAALREVLTHLAAHRTVIVSLDDLQWADVDSLEILADIMRGPAAPALLLLLSCRHEPRREVAPGSTTTANLDGSAVERQLGELGTAREHIELGPLTGAEAETLAQRLLGAADKAVVARIASESAGVPFFISELAMYSRDNGARPAAVSLDGVLRARFRALGAEERRLMEAVALAGAPLPQGVAATALDRDPARVTQMLRRLRTGNFLRAPDGRGTDQLECYHSRIRDMVLAGMSRRRCRALHRGLALGFEAWPGSSLERLARHWFGAGEGGRATEYALRAAREAAELAELDRAARLYRLALDIRELAGAPRRGAYRAMGEVLVHAGRPVEAAAAFNRAARGASPADALELRRTAAVALLRGGHVRKGLRWLEAVLEHVGMRLARTPRRAIASILWRRALLRIRGLRWRERNADALSPQVLTRIDTAHAAALALALIDTPRGFDFQARHLLLALRHGEPTRVARALALEAGYLMGQGKARRAELLAAQAEELLASGRVADDVAVRPFILWVRGARRFFTDNRWREARDILDEAAAYLRSNRRGGGWELAPVDQYRLVCRLYLGEIGELADTLPRQLRAAERRGDHYTAINVRSRLNLVWLVCDDLETAGRNLEIAHELWPPLEDDLMQVQHNWLAVASVELALYRGDLDGAERSIEGHMARLRRSLMARVPLTWTEALGVYGRVCVAVAGAYPGTARARQALGRARQCVRRLTGVMPIADATAQLLSAGVAEVCGEQARATALLTGGAAAMEALETSLHALCARRHLAARAGEPLEPIDAALRARRVGDPAALARLLVPGF